MNRIIRFLSSTRGYGLLIIRVWLGGAMMYYSHGYVFTAGGLTDFSNYASSLGIPLAGVLGPVAKLFEFFGGVMILIGFYGRVGALLIAPVLLVATIYAHNFEVFTSAGISFNLFLMNLIIVLEGTGKYSLKTFPQGLDSLNSNRF